MSNQPFSYHSSRGSRPVFGGSAIGTSLLKPEDSMSSLGARLADVNLPTLWFSDNGRSLLCSKCFEHFPIWEWVEGHRLQGEAHGGHAQPTDYR